MSGSDAVRIVDPVHGYITITPIERGLLDSRPAQRLRYVGQSGLAHLVFPDLRTSRFVHSLGAMHLASRFLLASLENASKDDRAAAEIGICDAVEEILGELATASKAAGGLAAEGLLCDRVASAKCRDNVLLAEQALRLAALFHDLGHLPFSHDFEYALQQLAAEEEHGKVALIRQSIAQDALHERIGHRLTFLLIKDAYEHASNDTLDTLRVTFELARRILETNEAQATQTASAIGGLGTSATTALAWLHTLIAGELDVDRCDYVLRDARSYAFESAYYDLERLIQNVTVVRHPETDKLLLPAVLPRGQPAVESFLIARSRIYQWGPRHHKVAQVAAALRYAIGEMLREAVRAGHKDNPLHQFIDDLEEILAATKETKNASELLDRFACYDDQWWMGHMRESASARDDPWFNLVCWRTRGPKTLWKRAVEFPEEIPENMDLAEWNSRLPAPTQLQRRKAFDDAVRSLRDHGVLVVRHTFAPWRPTATTEDHDQPESALNFYDPDRSRLSPVTRLSYPVASLREAWLRDLQVHAFARDTSPAISAAEVVQRLTIPSVGG